MIKVLINLLGLGGGTKAKRWLDSYERRRSYFPSSSFVNNPEIFSEKFDKAYNVKILGLIKNKRTYRFVSDSLLDEPLLDKWKFYLPKANGSGSMGALGQPTIGEPFSGCTESFLQIGPFESEVNCSNCIKYIKTKFSRALLGTLKVTQDNPKSVWVNIPIQDFSLESDIDWSTSISGVDQQLYKKYNLNKKEIYFIETNVRAMD